MKKTKKISIKIGRCTISLRFENEKMLYCALREKYKACLTISAHSAIINIKVGNFWLYLPKEVNPVTNGERLRFVSRQDKDYIIFPQSIAYFHKKALYINFVTSELDIRDLNYVIYFTYLRWLQQGKGINLHSSGVIDSDSGGYLFVGPSGSGKSTIARLGRNRRLLNDDENIVERYRGAFRILSFTDWRDIKRDFICEALKLNKIFFLQKGNDNLVYPMKKTSAIYEVLRNILRIYPKVTGVNLTVDFCVELVKKIPCYMLEFRPDESIWNTIM